MSRPNTQPPSKSLTELLLNTNFNPHILKFVSILAHHRHHIHTVSLVFKIMTNERNLLSIEEIRKRKTPDAIKTLIKRDLKLDKGNPNPQEKAVRTVLTETITDLVRLFNISRFDINKAIDDDLTRHTISTLESKKILSGFLGLRKCFLELSDRFESDKNIENANEWYLSGEVRIHLSKHLDELEEMINGLNKKNAHFKGDLIKVCYSYTQPVERIIRGFTQRLPGDITAMNSLEKHIDVDPENKFQHVKFLLYCKIILDNCASNSKKIKANGEHLNAIIFAFNEILTMLPDVNKIANKPGGIDLLRIMLVIDAVIPTKDAQNKDIEFNKKLVEKINQERFDINVAICQSYLMQTGNSKVVIGAKVTELLQKSSQGDALKILKIQGLTALASCFKLMEDSSDNKGKAGSKEKWDVINYKNCLNEIVVFHTSFKLAKSEDLQNPKVRLLLGNLVVAQIKLFNFFKNKANDVIDEEKFDSLNKAEQKKLKITKSESLLKSREALLIAARLVISFSATKDRSLLMLEKRDLKTINDFIPEDEIKSVSGIDGLFDIISNRVLLIEEEQESLELSREDLTAILNKHKIEQKPVPQEKQDEADKAFKALMKAESILAKKRNDRSNQRVKKLRATLKELEDNFEKYKEDDLKVSDADEKIDYKQEALDHFRCGRIDVALSIFSDNNDDCIEFHVAKNISRFCAAIASPRKGEIPKDILKEVFNAKLPPAQLENIVYLYVGRTLTANHNYEKAIEAYDTVINEISLRLPHIIAQDDIEKASLALAKNAIEAATCRYILGSTDINESINNHSLKDKTKQLEKSLKFINKAMEAVCESINLDKDELNRAFINDSLEEFVKDKETFEIATYCCDWFHKIQNSFAIIGNRIEMKLESANASRNAAIERIGIEAWCSNKKTQVSEHTITLNNLKNTHKEFKESGTERYNLSLQFVTTLDYLPIEAKGFVVDKISVPRITFEKAKPSTSPSQASMKGLISRNLEPQLSITS